MRGHRREDSPDTVELLLKLALGEIRPGEFDYLLQLAGDHLLTLHDERRLTTGLEAPSAAVIRGVCELVLWDAADFVRELTGLNAESSREQQIARQTFRIDVFLQDSFAQAIRTYLELAIRCAVSELMLYRLLDDRR